MITREQRTSAIEKLQTEFDGARGIFVTDINKIDVQKMTHLRAEFRKKGLRYIVVKNSLARKALERGGKSSVAPFLKGPTGVVIAKEEATAPAKVIRDFHKVNKDLLGVRAAYVDGSLYDAAQADRLADIPSREVLLSQLLSCMQAPMANLAGALNGILGKLVGTLEAVKAQKEPSQQ
jgi:large subunit ribosomal protein L10